jgi:hypothetical protein
VAAGGGQQQRGAGDDQVSERGIELQGVTMTVGVVPIFSTVRSSLPLAAS